MNTFLKIIPGIFIAISLGAMEKKEEKRNGAPSVVIIVNNAPANAASNIPALGERDGYERTQDNIFVGDIRAKIVVNMELKFLKNPHLSGNGITFRASL